MLGMCRKANYFPILKWKQGERQALETCDRRRSSRLVPIFVVPPAGDYEHDEGRRLTPTEHIRTFGAKLRDAWEGRPAFVDAELIDDELHRRSLSAHPLTELLEKARLAKASLYPVTSLGRPEEYQEAVKRFVVRNPGLPVAFRLTASQFDSSTLAADLNALISYIGCATDRIVIVIDFGDQSAIIRGEVSSFSDLLIERLSELPFLHDWLNVVVAMTAFPTVVKQKAGQTQRYLRGDWLIYAQMLMQQDQILRLPAFGDYAIDPGAYKKSVRATPSAQFRYTGDDEYVIVKGAQAKAPVGYGAIYPVADETIALKEFSGKEYSKGDHFIFSLAKRKNNSGNASTWRWAGTDHHFAHVTSTLDRLRGISIETAAPEEEQQSLFDFSAF